MSQMNVSNSLRARLSLGRALALSLGVASTITACGGEADTTLRGEFLPGNIARLSAAGTGAVEAVGGAGGATGGSGAGGSGGTAAAEPAPVVNPDTPSGAAQVCNRSPAPATGLLIDFSTYVSPAGTWGDSGFGQITGGTAVYSVRPDADLTITTEGDQLHLTANMMTNGDYTGIVLWFAPCVDASAYSGLTFPVTGSLGGARMQVKAQTSPDYPVDVANSKGQCEYPREDEKFDVCQQPVVNIDALEMNPLVLGWDQFTGGVPLPEVDAAQLLGFELQFQCQATEGACAVDVTIGTVNFMP